MESVKSDVICGGLFVTADSPVYFFSSAVGTSQDIVGVVYYLRLREKFVKQSLDMLSWPQFHSVFSALY